jgi:hypothetical protein
MHSDKQAQIAAVGQDLFCIDQEHIRDVSLVDMLTLMAILELCPRAEAARLARWVDVWEQDAVADQRIERARDRCIRIYYNAGTGLTASDVEAVLPIFRRCVQRINPSMPLGWAQAAADWWSHPTLGGIFLDKAADTWYCASSYSSTPSGTFASARAAAETLR